MGDWVVVLLAVAVGWGAGFGAACVYLRGRFRAKNSELIRIRRELAEIRIKEGGSNV